MATYIVSFSGSVEVEDESSEESEMSHVQNYTCFVSELDFEAEEIIEPNDIIEDEGDDDDGLC